jgi:hypothetical protein
VINDSYLLKLFWVVLILCVFALGFYNIHLAVNDYYNFDVITNIERVTPEYVTFPAITVCAKGYNYINLSIDVNTGIIFADSLNISLIKNFIAESYFHEKFKKIGTDVGDLLDFFTVPVRSENLELDCFRFNAVINKSVEFIKARSSGDYFQVTLKPYKDYVDVTRDKYVLYNVRDLLVYIGGNHLNSFETLEPLSLSYGSVRNVVRVQKEFVETKLPQPFNPCQESSDGKLYHRWNCIEACVARKTKNEFNCTFPFCLFAVAGYMRCGDSWSFYWQRFSEGCQKVCYLEDCFSENYIQDVELLFSESGTILQFSFRYLSTLNITQIPKTDPYTFINNIGGGLGLFMGIAFPNLIEFLQFIVEIFVIAFVR